MIKEAGIDFANLPDSEADSPLGEYTGAGTIFGITGGVTEAVIRYVLADSSEGTLQTIAECGVRGLQGTKAFEISAGDLKIRIAVVNGLGYLDKLGLDEGWMAVFDEDKTKPWDEKIFLRDELFGSKTIHVVGL